MSVMEKITHDNSRTGTRYIRARTLKRLTLLVAGLVLLAALACKPPTYEGIVDLGIDMDGQIIAHAIIIYPYGESTETFRSRDGGITWKQSSSSDHRNRDISWGGNSVDTHRGSYSLATDGVGFRTPDARTLAYSTEYLNSIANRTQQLLTTRPIATNRILSLEPRYIVYHQETGNVVVSLGLQGVVVEDSSGTWHRISVGPYAPTDFSFGARLSTAFTEPGFWPTGIAASIAFSCAAVLFARRHLSCAEWLVALFSTSVLLLTTLFAMATLYSDGNFGVNGLQDSFLGGAGIVSLVIVLLFALPNLAYHWSYSSLKLRHLFLFGGFLLLMIALFYLAFLIDASTPFYSTTSGKIYAFIFLSVVGTAFAIYLRRKLDSDYHTHNLSTTTFWGKPIKSPKP